MKRIYVLSRNSVFGKGIEKLLAQEAGMDIVGSDVVFGESVECIQKCSPDIVILNCDEPDKDLTDAVLWIIQQRLDITVIGMSLKDNKLCIYRGEQKQVRQLEDLLAVVRE